MHERIKEVMADVFEVSPQDIPDDADTENVEQWDSLGHMQLMLALEAEFEVEIPTETMLELISLEEIEEFLRASGTAVSE